MFIVSISAVYIPFIIKYVGYVTLITEFFILSIITLQAHNYIQKCILGYLRKFISARGYLKSLGTTGIKASKERDR
jgi:hypothetical protein